MVDRSGVMRVLGLAEIGHGGEVPSIADITTVHYMAPELTDISPRFDARADIYSLGWILLFLLTGRAPFSQEPTSDRSIEHPTIALALDRPDVPPALASFIDRMTAPLSDDRPTSMAEVIAHLQACAGMAIDVESNRPDRARQLDRAVAPELSLASSAAIPPLKWLAASNSRISRARKPAAIWIVAAIGLTAATIMFVAVSQRFIRLREHLELKQMNRPNQPRVVADAKDTPPPAIVRKFKIFDGHTTQGWMLSNRRPVPASNVQPDGLNPHRSGSYLLVYDRKVGDFVLDFDYKLSKGCNSGVFLRVSDLNNPIETGIEVALDDTTWGDDRDSGGFFGLVAPSSQEQKPSGQWNHMTVSARGPLLTVDLNGREVSSIDLDVWTEPGNRPDGSNHRFSNRAIDRLPRTGYLGFQDLGGDCWFRNIVIERSSAGP
jgi:hypothetical protein